MNDQNQSGPNQRPSLPDADSLSKLLQAEMASNSERLAPEDEIRLTELMIIIADSQMQWLGKALASIRRLYPHHADSALDKVLTGGAVASLEAEYEFVQQSAALHRASLTIMRAAWPADQPRPWRATAQMLGAYDHFTYPLGTLMQALPGDITNQTRLTPEQGRMCESVAALAYGAQDTLQDGLEAVAALLQLAGQQLAPALLPAVGRLMAYLTTEARFMAQNAAEYGAAAREVVAG